ncbi:MAG: YggS family pyridoxal phosphate-dependent enzyme, partial [Bacteroidota bacterium]
PRRAVAPRVRSARRSPSFPPAERWRDPSEITLIAVTKTHPIETIEAALEAGLTDFGENRVQELASKAATLPGEHAGGRLRWHLIGSLQSNKSRDAVELADLFHALDRPKLVRTLNDKAAEAGRILPVLIQVNISDEDSKHGVAPQAAHDLIARVADASHLRVVGLMGMAAPAHSEQEKEQIVRPAFIQLRQIRDSYTGPGASSLRALSMGMSGDYEIAIEEGATHVRIGSALFGAR